MIITLLVMTSINCLDKNKCDNKGNNIVKVKPPDKIKKESIFPQSIKDETIANLKKYPESGPAHDAYALLLLSDGNIDGAIKEFQIAIKLSPNNPMSYMSLAEEYRREGDSQKRYMYITMALILDENNPVIYSQLISYYRDRGKTNKVRKYLELQRKKLLLLMPGQRVYIDHFGNSLIFSGDENREIWIENIEKELNGL